MELCQIDLSRGWARRSGAFVRGCRRPSTADRGGTLQGIGNRSCSENLTRTGTLNQHDSAQVLFLPIGFGCELDRRFELPVCGGSQRMQLSNHSTMFEDPSAVLTATNVRRQVVFSDGEKHPVASPAGVLHVDLEGSGRVQS